MKTTYAPFDPARYLDNDTVIAEYLSAARRTRTPTSVSPPSAMSPGTRIAQVAKTSGLGRESLYKALGAGPIPATKR